MVTAAPYYSTTTGSIERSERVENGTTYSRSENFNSAYNIGVEASVMMKPAEWVNFRLGGDLYNRVNRGGTVPGDFYSSATGFSGNASFTINLLEGMTFTGNAFFGRPPVVGGSKSNGYSYVSLALRQKLLDDKLNVTLRANDPFNMQKWSSSYSTPEFMTEQSGKWTSRFVGLTISYNFGTTPRMEMHRQEKSQTKGSGGSGGGGGGQSGGQ
jgi:hypothetical protein